LCLVAECFHGARWARLAGAGSRVAGRRVSLGASGLYGFAGVVERWRRHHDGCPAHETDGDVDVQQDPVDDLRQELPVVTHLHHHRLIYLPELNTKHRN